MVYFNSIPVSGSIPLTLLYVCVLYLLTYSRRGTLLSTAIFLYAITSPVNGYFGAALYSRYGGKSAFIVTYHTAENFSLDKNFSQPSFICISEIFRGIDFHPCGKGHHRLPVITD